MPGKSRSSEKTCSEPAPPPSRNTRKWYRKSSEAVPEESQTADSNKSKTDKKTTGKGTGGRGIGCKIRDNLLNNQNSDRGAGHVVSPPPKRN